MLSPTWLALLLPLLAVGAVLADGKGFSRTPSQIRKGPRGVDLYIAGNRTTDARSFPHHAAILSFHDVWEINYCGGSLVAPQWVLSSALCLNPCTGDATESCFKYHRIILGANELQKEEAQQQHFVADTIFLHPEHTSKAEHDLALIKLSEPATITEYVRPVSMPWNLLEDDLSDYEILLSGWGETEKGAGPPSSELRVGELRAWGRLSCRIYNFNAPNPEDLLCTFGDAPCTGDIGGALVVALDGGSTWTQVAVSTGSAQCGQNYYLPVMNTRLDNYLPWIQQLTGVGPS